MKVGMFFIQVRILCITIFSLLFLSKGWSNNSIVLVKGSKVQHAIVVPVRATATERNAAAQLAKHLSVYGNFSIISESQTTTLNRIFIGNTSTFGKKVGNINRLVGRDGIVIKFIGNDIFIHGERGRAVLYASYEFLEKFVRINFWTPTDFDYPKYTNGVQIQSQDIVYTPPFYYRGGYSNNANTNKEFAAILKENGDFQPTDSDWGTVNKILGWCHTFNTILPYATYGKLHPEWFLDPKTGQPLKVFDPNLNGLKTQPYFYNENMKREFLKNTLSWIAANPKYDIISISQNDNTLFTKPKDNSLNASDLLLQFLNDIAAEVVKKYPGKKIETLAYRATEPPPNQVRSAKNLIVRIAPITANMGYAYDSPINGKPFKRLQGWLKGGGELFYWGYNTNFKYPALPYPSFGRLNTDLRMLASNGFTGIFMLDNLNTVGYFEDMKAWVLAKLMWNPKLDQEVLIKQFFRGYFKEASEPLYQYYKLVEKTYLSTPRVLAAYQADYSFLNQGSFLNKGQQLFSQAANLASEATIRNRVEEERLSFEFLNAYLGKRNKRQVDMLIKKYDGKVLNKSERSTLNSFVKDLNSKVLR